MALTSEFASSPCHLFGVGLRTPPKRATVGLNVGNRPSIVQPRAVETSARRPGIHAQQVSHWGETCGRGRGLGQRPAPNNTHDGGSSLWRLVHRRVPESAQPVVGENKRCHTSSTSTIPTDASRCESREL
jgi:hypothetical protein